MILSARGVHGRHREGNKTLNPKPNECLQGGYDIQYGGTKPQTLNPNPNECLQGGYDIQYGGADEWQGGSCWG
jgi:hypothetical protein